MNYIYLLPFEDGINYKLGISSNNLNRVFHHHNNYKIKLEEVKLYMCDDRNIVTKTEDYLKKSTKRKYVKKYDGLDGYTEIRSMMTFDRVSNVLESDVNFKMMNVKEASSILGVSDTNNINREENFVVDRRLDKKFYRENKNTIVNTIEYFESYIKDHYSEILLTKISRYRYKATILNNNIRECFLLILNYRVCCFLSSGRFENYKIFNYHIDGNDIIFDILSGVSAKSVYEIKSSISYLRYTIEKHLYKYHKDLYNIRDTIEQVSYVLYDALFNTSKSKLSFGTYDEESEGVVVFKGTYDECLRLNNRIVYSISKFKADYIKIDYHERSKSKNELRIGYPYMKLANLIYCDIINDLKDKYKNFNKFINYTYQLKGYKK